MARKDDEEGQDRASSFESEVDAPQVGLIREFVDFLRTNKKWWLTPILVALLAIGVLIVLGGTALGPFIYPFF